MGQWVRLLGGVGAGSAPWVPVAVVGALAVAGASAGAALIVVLAWLVGALVVVVVATVAVVVVLRRRAEAWRPFGADAWITAGPRLTEGHQCAVCAPVYVPAAAMVAGPSGQLLGLCLAHRSAAELVMRRAIVSGGAR